MGFGRDLVHLMQDFMNAKSIRAEGIYGALFVALMAAFERYVRMLIIHIVESVSSRAKTFDEVPKPLANRNLVLTGRGTSEF